MNVSLMPNFNSYAMFLYQNQGQLYSEDGSRTALDSKTNLDAFHYFMRLFTDYNLPYAYNFVTRFRTGEKMCIRDRVYGVGADGHHH